MTYRERMEAAQATSEAARLRGTAAKVFLDLAHHGIESWPSLKRLAKRAGGVSDRTVRRVLRSLEAAGLVQTIESPGCKNRYLVRLLPAARSEANATPDTSVRGHFGTPDISVRPPRTPVSAHPGHQCPGHPNSELNIEMNTHAVGVCDEPTNEDIETIGQIEHDCGLAGSRGRGRKQAAGRLRVLIGEHGIRLVRTAAKALPDKLTTNWPGCTTIGGAMVVMEKHLTELSKVQAHREAEEARTAELVRTINAERERMAGEREDTAAARAKWSRMDEADRELLRQQIIATSPKLLRDAPHTVEVLAIKAIAESGTRETKPEEVTT